MKNKWNPEELRERAQKIREALKPKSITPEMVGGTLHDLVDGVKEVEQSLQERTDHAILELQRTGAATPRFSGHIVESDIDYDDECMFMGSAQHTSTDPGCAVVFIRSLGIFALRVLEGATVTLSEMATANGPSEVSPYPGIIDPGVWSPGSDDEPLYQSVKFYLNWVDAADMGMHPGETGYEPVPGVMYMCTLSPYGFMRFESADDSAGFPYEAIRVQLMGDSEDIKVNDNALFITERTKRLLFRMEWLALLAHFPNDETYEADVAATTEDCQQYGLNGLVFNYQTAIKIKTASVTNAQSGNNIYSSTTFNGLTTFFPTVIPQIVSCQAMYRNKKYLEVVSVSSGTNYLMPSNMSYMFTYCEKLVKIYGVINMNNVSAMSECFNLCNSLISIKLYKLKTNINFHHSALLSLESLKYMVNNAINTSAITITVHPDVFAKLTGDTSNAAAAELSDEELAAWGELAILAVSKNISFAS